MFLSSAPKARYQMLRVLLNLALSDKTVGAVVEHPTIRTGLVHTEQDRANLTHKAASVLQKIKIRLKMVDQTGKQALIERVQEFAATQDRHVMISYCWEQQEVVLRIKAALAKRGIHCWLDVEQMSGSTVDAMADAIDKSYAVLFGISLGYKESPNCRLEVSGSTVLRRTESISLMHRLRCAAHCTLPAVFSPPLHALTRTSSCG